MEVRAVVWVMLLLLWLAVLLLPFAIGSWRSLLAFCALCLLISVGVKVGVASFSAADVPKALVTIGNVWLDLFVWALPVPIIARATVLSAKSLGLRGVRLVALNVIAILAVPGVWLGLVAYERWERRPAPAECTAKPILLSLADVDGSVPWSNAIQLYLGPDLPDDARYLFSPKSQRRICSDTSNGAERLTTSAISIELWSPSLDRCRSSKSQMWEKMLCARREDGTLRNLPHDIVIFNPNGIRLGDFGISSAATDEDYALAEGERLVIATRPKAGTVKAVCRTALEPNGSTLCRMRREVGAGASVYWDLYAPPDEIADRLLQAEGVARRICASVFDLPGCNGVDPSAP